MARLAFILSALVLLTGGGVLLGIQSAESRNAMYHVVTDLRAQLAVVVTEAKARARLGGQDPIHLVQPARHAGAGVTRNSVTDDDLIMIAGFFGDTNQVRLVERDGTVVKAWSLAFFDLFPDPGHLDEPPTSDLNIDLHGTLLEPDGSMLANFEYMGLVKLDRCGAVDWTLEHRTHHSIEPASTGGWWVPGRSVAVVGPDRLQPFGAIAGDEALLDDLILRIDAEGRIVEQRSVAQILIDNGLMPLLTATGHTLREDMIWDYEIVHVNKIGELGPEIAAAFPDFAAGDLIVSERTYNLLFVVDPRTWQVKWHQVGPWLRQHDPEFNADGTITVFNNNTFYTALQQATSRRLATDGAEHDGAAVPRSSDILRFDPSLTPPVVEQAYGGRPGEAFLTVVRGKHEPTPEGGLLVTEFEAGRIFEVDADRRLIWEYVNRYDAERVGEVTEARRYSRDYFDFDVADWRCDAPTA